MKFSLRRHGQDSLDERVGENLHELLRNSQLWVHRRVDSLRLDIDGSTRRYVSVDLTLPRNRAVEGSAGQILVPLGILEKGTKRRLDATFEGKSVPVLGRKDTGDLIAEMLLDARPSVMTSSERHHEDPAQLFSAIATCHDYEVTDLVQRYVQWKSHCLRGREVSGEQAQKIDQFDRIVHQMLSNYILFVEIDGSHAGRRIVLKYALDQEEPGSKSPGTKRLVIVQPIPDLGYAASHHVEVEVPPGLLVANLVLVELGPDPEGRDDIWVESTAEPSRIAHLNISPKRASSVGFLRADITIATQGIFRFTATSVICLTFITGLAWLVMKFDPFFLPRGADIPSPAASIILVGPALLVSWISRLPEHPLVSRVVQPLRNILLLNAVSLVLMAGLAAVAVQAWIWLGVWVFVTLLTTWTLVRLTYFYLELEWRPFRRGVTDFRIEYSPQKED